MENQSQFPVTTRQEATRGEVAGAMVEAQALAGGHALIRLENQTQMQVALQRPRNEPAILAAAIRELETYRAAAEQAVYCKPAGKNDQGQMVYVTGLSIRAAESLAARWDNSSYGTEVISEDAESVTIGAVFLDMERNTRHALCRRVSRSIRKRGGGLMKLDGDRFDQHLAAQASKLLREVILRSLPAGLKADYMQKAQEVAASTSTGNIEIMLQKFRGIGVQKDEIEGLLGHEVSKITGDDLKILRGVFNAIDGQECSVEDAFGEARARIDAQRAASVKGSKKEAPPAKETPAPQTKEPPQPAKEQPPVTKEPEPAKEPQHQVTKEPPREPDKQPDLTGEPEPKDCSAIFASIDAFITEKKVGPGLLTVAINKVFGGPAPTRETWTPEQAESVLKNLRGLKK